MEAAELVKAWARDFEQLRLQHTPESFTALIQACRAPWGAGRFAEQRSLFLAELGGSAAAAFQLRQRMETVMVAHTYMHTHTVCD